MFTRLFLAFAMLIMTPLTDARTQRIAASDPQSIHADRAAKKAAQMRKGDEGSPATFAKG